MQHRQLKTQEAELVQGPVALSSIGDAEASAAVDGRGVLLASTSTKGDEAPLLPLSTQRQDCDGDFDAPTANLDRGWAYAFKINVVVTVISAVWFGTLGIQALKDTTAGVGRRRLHSGGHEAESSPAHTWMNVILGVVILLSTASLVAGGMLPCLFHCNRGVMFAPYWLFAGSMAVSTLSLAFRGHFFGAIFPALLCALIVLYVRRRKHRIEFTSANVKVASLAIRSMPQTVWTAFLMSLVQLCWCAISFIAAIGSFAAFETVKGDDGTSYQAVGCMGNQAALFAPPEQQATLGKTPCMCNGTRVSEGDCEYSGLGAPLMIVWLLSLLWGCAVIKNVLACTVSGSVASWWFTPNEDPAPVKGALYRATHSSFGSLCKAAVVMNIVAILNSFTRQILRFIPCAGFLVSWANVAVKYVISYTITFVGIYGLSFNAAGRRVKQLFRGRAVTTIANDVLVEVGLVLLTVSAATIYTTLSMIVFSMEVSSSSFTATSLNTFEFWSVVGPQIFGLATFFMLIATMCEVVRSGFKTVFVCFVQDPSALAEKHEAHIHDGLNTAWLQLQARMQPRATVTGSTHSYQHTVPATVV